MMCMDTFAFMIHPIDTSDIYRKFPFLKRLPDTFVETALSKLPPLKVSEITGIKSACNETRGWFVGCPLTTRKMIRLPEKKVLRKIIKTGKLAEKLGAKILGLGAFTSVVGDAGVTVAKNLKIPVTTGNSYTVATAIEGAIKAAELMGIDYSTANIAVVGATGSIGKVCAHYLAREVKYLTIVGKNYNKLLFLAEKILKDTGLSVVPTTNTSKAIRNSDIIITVTSSLDTIIHPEDLKPGSVVCDVARPRDVSQKVASTRDDVLVIEGGVVDVPGDVNFNFNFGFPPKKAYACMAETMILSLEQRYECFTLGRDLTIQQVDEITSLAKKHGFKLSGLRSFERELTPEQINQIKSNARKKLKARKNMLKII